MKGSQQETQTVVTPALQEELKLLRGFAQLMAERTAYMFGAKALTTEMGDKTKAERKTLAEANKLIHDNLPKWVKDADVRAYEKSLATVKDARKVLNDKQKPIRDKVAPLRKGMKYIDVVAVPDSIKEMASVVSDEEVKKHLVIAPTFKLSEWLQKAVETKRKSD